MAHLKYFVIFFFPIMSAYVLNWFQNHLLLSDALHFAIKMHLKLKKETQILLALVNLIDDDFKVVFVGL
jgi:hypothetical protein